MFDSYNSFCKFAVTAFFLAADTGGGAGGGAYRMHVTPEELATKRKKPVEQIKRLVAMRAIPSEVINGVTRIPRRIYDQAPSDNEWQGYRVLDKENKGRQLPRVEERGVNSWQHVKHKLAVEPAVLLRECPADCFHVDNLTGEKFPDWVRLNAYWLKGDNSARLRRANITYLSQSAAEQVQVAAEKMTAEEQRAEMLRQANIETNREWRQRAGLPPQE